MFHDSGWQDLTLETGHESTICSDLSTFPARKFKSVKADELIRSKTSSCFPEVTGEQYERLKDDIQRNGQLNPILVHGNEVVDGWTRCRICGELGLKAMVLEISDQNEIRATLSSQFNRGHFSQLQKAAIIRDAVDARGRGRPKKESEPDHFLNELAKEYGVDQSYLKLVGRVKREKPEWMEDIKRGKITYGKLNASMQNFKNTPPKQVSKPKATATQPEQTAKPAVLEDAPEQASTLEPSETLAEVVVDQDGTPGRYPEALEVLKLLRRILARLPNEEKSKFNELIEPVCFFLEIDPNLNYHA